MQPTSNQDYKQLLTDVIKKQIVILGPEIALSKARSVSGLTVADDGTVTNVVGTPETAAQALIDQFVELSGLIVKETMGPLLSSPTAKQTVPLSPQPAPSTAGETPTHPVLPQAEQSSIASPTPVAPVISANQNSPVAPPAPLVEKQAQPLSQAPLVATQSPESLATPIPPIPLELHVAGSSPTQTSAVPTPAANPLAS